MMLRLRIIVTGVSGGRRRGEWTRRRTGRCSFVDAVALDHADRRRIVDGFDEAHRVWWNSN